jgi:hypothetical protein
MTESHKTAAGEISGSVLFYSQPEPLAPELHGKLGVKRMDGPFKFAAKGHAVPLTVGEFQLAAVSGPIIFVGDEKLPLAVMGLRPAQLGAGDRDAALVQIRLTCEARRRPQEPVQLREAGGEPLAGSVHLEGPRATGPALRSRPLGREHA